MPVLVNGLIGGMEGISNDSLRKRPFGLPLSSCFTLIETINVRKKHKYNLYTYTMIT